jgi:hypothetical protein
MGPEEVKLKRLTYLEDPLDFLKESEKIVFLMFPQFDFSLIRRVFADIERLFSGKYPGYRGCTTRYHDLNHTLHCFLLTARLIHGAFVNGIVFKEEDVVLGLISALMHDTGYIQLVGDRTGTGGKYTLVHVERSIEVMEKYFNNNRLELKDFMFCRDCVKCTKINIKIKNIQFKSYEHEILGKILVTDDLIGQMADRHYLIKLPFLYEELKEGGVSIFTNDLDLFKATPGFWEFTKKRFITEYGNVDRYLRDHFRVRWGIDQDLDREAIERNIKYLKFILDHHEADYRGYISYEGIKAITSEIRRLEGTEKT